MVVVIKSSQNINGISGKIGGFNVKSDLYPLIINNLKVLYGIHNIKDLFVYTYIRCSLYEDRKNLNNIEILNFMINELNISTFTNLENNYSSFIVYEGFKYTLEELNLDVMDNFEFQADINMKVDVYPILKEVYKKGYLRALKFKQSIDYSHYILRYRLLMLNNHYNAIVIPAININGFHYSTTHNPFERNMEEKLDAILHHSRFTNTDTTNITEEQLEDYLIKNISLIEDGMTYLSRQVEITNGTIDILASDIDNNLCIIEVKISEDKAVVWQSIYYPKEIKKKYKSRNVRMIIVAPNFKKYMLDVLNEINVELFDYEIVVDLEEIRNLKINRLIQT